MRCYWLCRVGFIFLLVFGLAGSLLAGDTATVSGRVTDPSGAVIPGAEVDATNVDTNQVYSTVTNEQGLYVVLNLPPGRYRIIVGKTGFRTIVKPDIVLHVQDSIAQNFSMEVGSVIERVTVEGGTPLLQSESGSVGTLITREFVENLPMNGRSFQTLIELTPGAVLTPASRNQPGQFSVNGQRSNANNFIIDGVSANFGSPVDSIGQQGGGTTPALTQGGGTNGLVSIDALEEFRIQTSTYAAEFGRQPGGQVSVRTRSGTNTFHGTLSEYFRNDKLDARDWFSARAGLDKAPLRQNDFGGVLGGPLVPDKAFFFVSYEGLRLRQPRTELRQIPTLAFREITPASTRPLVDAFPIPNGPDISFELAEHTSIWSDPSSLDAYSFKLDQQLKKMKLFGRFSFSPSDSARIVGGNRDQPSKSDSQTLTLGATTAFTSNTVNDFRINWSRNEVSRRARQLAIDGAIPPPDSVLFPSFASSETGRARISIFSVGTIVSGKYADSQQRQIHIVNTLSHVSGNHQLKFGGDYRRLSPQYGVAPFDSSFIFFGLSELLLERPFAVTVQASDSGFSYRFSNWSFFAQDTWRATPRLTLTFGWRWEYNTPPSEKNDRLPFTVQGLDDPATMTLAPAGTPLWNPSLKNFAPRVGVAFDLAPDHGLILRGGYGIYYDLGTGSALIGASSFPYVRDKFLFRPTWPLSDATQTPPDFTTDPPVDRITAFDPNLKLPYSEQWNIAVEKSLGPDQTISLTYLRQESHRLLGMEIIRKPNPDFDLVRIERGRAGSKYRALQVQFQRRMSAGLQALTSYSFSRSTDNASTDGLPSSGLFQLQDPEFDWGLSSFDVKHSFTAGFHYEIPAPAEQGWARGVFGNWAVQGIFRAQSGTPLTVTANKRDNSLGGLRTVRPDMVPGEPLWIPDSSVPNGRRLNLAAFTLPPDGQQGNHQRNSIRGFGLWQADVGVSRDFLLTESVRFQLGLEAFNTLNHPNFGSIQSSLSARSSFGTTFNTLASSLSGGGVLSGLSPIYQVGGARSIQIKLKLLF